VRIYKNDFVWGKRLTAGYWLGFCAYRKGMVVSRPAWGSGEFPALYLETLMLKAGLQGRRRFGFFQRHIFFLSVDILRVLRLPGALDAEGVIACIYLRA
jgi:hypothetical protein